MGDLVTNAALSTIERRLDKVAESTSRIERELGQTNSRLTQVTSELNDLSTELSKLKASFDRFMDDSRKATTLQKAATELIRVRQELEQNFGGYKVVRETMLKNADKKVLLCDSSKFSVRAPFKQCELGDVDYLISEETCAQRFSKYQCEIELL